MLMHVSPYSSGKKLLRICMGVILIMGLCIPSNITWAKDDANANSDTPTSSQTSATSRATHDSAPAPTRSDQTQALIDKTGTRQGFLDIPIDYTQLNAAAAKAKEAGLSVSSTSPEIMVSSTTALSDALKTITATRDEELKTLTDATKTYRDHMADYTTKKAAYDTALKTYHEKLAQFVHDNEAYKAAYQTYLEARKTYEENYKAYEDAHAKHLKDKQAHENLVKTYKDEHFIWSIHKKEYDDAYSAWKKIKAEWDEKKKAYDEAYARYQEQTKAWKQAQADYQAKHAAWKKSQGQYARDMATYQVKLKDYEEQKRLDTTYVQTHQTKGTLLKADGYALYGALKEGVSGVNHFSDIAGIFDAQKMKSYGTVEQLDQKLGMHDNTTIVPLSASVEKMGLDHTGNINPHANNLWQFAHIKKGDRFKMNHIGRTHSGRNVHAILTIEDVGVFTAFEDMAVIQFNRLSGDTIGFSQVGYNWMRLSLAFVDDANKPVTLAMSGVIADIDNYQYEWVSLNNHTSYYDLKGSLLKTETYHGHKSYYADEEQKTALNALDEKNHTPGKHDVGLFSINEAPMGSFLFAGVGNVFTIEHGVHHTRNPWVLTNKVVNKTGNDKTPYYLNRTSTYVYDKSRNLINLYIPTLGYGIGIEHNFFGNSMVNTRTINTIPEPPKKPTPPKEPEPTFNTPAPLPPTLIPPVPTPPEVFSTPEPDLPPTFTQKEPTPPALPAPLVAPQAPRHPGEAPVHPTTPALTSTKYLLRYQPSLRVDAINPETGETLASEIVPKNTPVAWRFTPDALPENTEQISSAEIRIPIPAGLAIDEESTRTSNPNWEMTRDGDTIVFKAGKQTLEDINNHKQPSVTLIGMTKHDGAIYEGIGELIYNKAHAISNIARIITPGLPDENLPPQVDIPDDPQHFGREHDTNISPELALYNTDGTRIIDNAVPEKDTLIYTMLWDTDQYHGMKAEGDFVYVLDIPDEDISFGESARAHDSSGKTYELTSTRYESLASAPAPLKQLIESCMIQPNGSFITYRISNKDMQSIFDAGENLILRHEARDFSPETFKARAYQIDFGKNGYATEEVSHRTPHPAPTAHILDTSNVVRDGEHLNHAQPIHYTLTWDLKPYKDLVASAAVLEKGFYYLDDVDSTAFPDEMEYRAYDEDGNEVALAYRTYSNCEEIDDPELHDTINACEPHETVRMFYPTDVNSFFENYVKPGKRVYIETHMTTSDDERITDIHHTSAQIDLGSSVQNEAIHNTMSATAPSKDAAVIPKLGNEILLGITAALILGILSTFSLPSIRKKQLHLRLKEKLLARIMK